MPIATFHSGLKPLENYKNPKFSPKNIHCETLAPNLLFKISSVYTYRIHPLKVYLMVFRKTA